MKIAMIGTGYVGLVTGVCFADRFNYVTCVDIDEDKINQLKKGECPIFEPDLQGKMNEAHRSGHLCFTTDTAKAVEGADVVFLAVCTPQAVDGSADISQLVTAAEQIAPYLDHDTVVVIKSTAPPNTTAIITEVIRDMIGWSFSGVVYNPEFLREGTAVGDFMHPDRVVIGAYDHAVKDVLFKLYAPFLRSDKDFLMMSPESAAMVKYASNAMLATKISFINEVANISGRVGANIDDVRAGMCKDPRIGTSFLNPGVGYGGSCFPKDVTALAHIGTNSGISPLMMEAVDKVNNIQQEVLVEKICGHFQVPIGGMTFALWGLAFKPNTDDIRESPACVLIDWLLCIGAKVRVHDPEALDNVRKVYGEHLEYFTDKMEALEGADALAISTEWPEYCHCVDFPAMRGIMKYPVIFDGRNIFDPSKMRRSGFDYYSIGRQTVYKDAT
jgi:UDPglucose 6-dehydrogenase